MDGEEESIFFLPFVTWMKLLSLCLKLAWKEGHNFSYNIQKKQNMKKKKITFDIPKLKFQNKLEQKTSNFLAFVCGRLTPPPKKKCAILFADYDPVNDGGILAHELVGGKSEMVV